MYIVAIAWLFVALLLAVTQQSLIAGVLTLFFWGVVPLVLLLWIIGTPARRLRKQKENAPEAEESATKK